jgi:hypothetical protein
MSEVRVAVERAFLAYDVPKIAELLGTIAVEDRGIDSRTRQRCCRGMRAGKYE